MTFIPGLLCSGSHCFQGLLGEDQGRLWLLPHGAEITLALIRKDAGRECLGELVVDDMVQVGHQLGDTFC